MQVCEMTPLGARFLPLCCSLLCLLLDRVSSEGIIATIGTDVTLSCNYNARTYGRLFGCWGRGSLPRRGCANEVIKSDGTTVVSRQSERYLLMGNLGEGDVSLTIRQVEESDSGIYGCRVEIPGLFNDHRHEQKLTVVAAKPNPLKVEVREVKERTVTVQWSPVFNGGRPITSYMVDLKNKQAYWNTAVTTEVHNPALTQITLMDLRPAKTYNLRMFARNIVGLSDSSNVLTITTKEAVPESSPQDVKLEALDSRSIRVTWKPPKAELRNGVLRSYTVSYRMYSGSSQHASPLIHMSVSATREEESVILTDLMPSSQYTVLIRAATNAGNGPYTAVAFCSTPDEVITTTIRSRIETTIRPTEVETFGWSSVASTKHTQLITSSSTVPMTAAPEPDSPPDTVLEQITAGVAAVPPDPPVLELQEITRDSISVFWTPGFEGDSPITGFYLEYKAENASWDDTVEVIDFSPNQTEATMVERYSSTYNIRMFAINRQGTSKSSNILTITTGQTGHDEDNLFPTRPSDSHVVAVVNGGNGNHHVAAIAIPVVLVVLVVATVTAWQCRRVKYKQGKLSLWMNHGAPRLRVSESLQEL